MPTKCVAFGCKNKAVYNETEGKLSFFRFPKKPLELRNAWIKAVKWQNWKPSPSSCLCSDHFAEEDIDRTSLSSVRLRLNAVPTIFPPFPPHLRKTKTRKKILRLNSDDSMSDISSDAEAPLNDVTSDKPPVVYVSGAREASLDHAYDKGSGFQVTHSDSNVEQPIEEPPNEPPSSSTVQYIAVPAVAHTLQLASCGDQIQIIGVYSQSDSGTPALNLALKPTRDNIQDSVGKKPITHKKAGTPSNIHGLTKRAPISGVNKQMKTDTMCFTNISREPELKYQLMRLHKKSATNQQKLKTAQQRIRRLSKANEKLAREVKELKDSCKPEATIDRLQKVAGINSQILKRQLCKSTGAIEPQEYTEDLRRFAMILYSHSIKAYEFVRQSFGGCLPHPRTIAEWRHPTKRTPIPKDTIINVNIIQ